MSGSSAASLSVWLSFLPGPWTSYKLAVLWVAITLPELPIPCDAGRNDGRHALRVRGAEA